MDTIAPHAQRVYRAEPTPAEFHRSNAFVRGIMGPIGSGKSVACALELYFRACGQVADHQGYRRTRWAVIRNTYPELRSTTIRTWIDWFPEPVCVITWAAPIEGRLKVRLPDGTTVVAEILFLSLDSPRDIKKLLSLELTGAWVNEARELPYSVIETLTGRVGRYPAKAMGPPITYSGVWMDTNPPDTDHWWYRLAELEQPEGWRFWRQPGAILVKGDPPHTHYEINPDAENVGNQPLGFQYWLRQIAGKTQEWIRVYLLAQYGATFDGRPVYGSAWQEHVHVSTVHLAVYHGLPLVLGWDFGLTPACVAVQLSPAGQLRILREWVCDDGGLRQFADLTVKPSLTNEFPGMTLQSWCDPAGAQRSQVDEATCVAELSRVGIPTTIAPTNQFQVRRQAVLNFLTRLSEGQPGLIVDPRCTMIRKGFGGGYMLKRMPVAGDAAQERFRDEPEKNAYSHPAEALQYAVLGVSSEYHALIETRQGVYRPESSRRSAFV